MLKLYIDGGARGNPGPAGVGVVILDADDEPIIERGYFIGHATNNVAEYNGLIKGLELVIELMSGGKAQGPLEIYSDSQLLVRQMIGQYKIKNAALKDLAIRAHGLIRASIGDVSFHHVPRDQNNVADGLANKAMDAKGNVF
jgi:ribonuclease HI